MNLSIFFVAAGGASSAARGLAEKMLTYALGRGLVISDQRQVKVVCAAVQQGDYRLHAMLHAVVQSSAFQTR